MNVSQFLLSLVHASGGRVRGRTMLQKKGFFVLVLTRLPVHLAYQAHYYGPYSATLDGTLTQLKNLGFIEEATTGFGVVSGGFEMRRYDYCLTNDGRAILEPLTPTAEYKAIAEAIKKIQEAGDPDYIELSVAAKAFYILRRKGKGMSVSDLQREAEKFNWSIPEQSLHRSIQFLQGVGLAHSG